MKNFKKVVKLLKEIVFSDSFRKRSIALVKDLSLLLMGVAFSISEGRLSTLIIGVVTLIAWFIMDQVEESL